MTTPLRVLLVEDSPTDAKLIVQELRRTGRPVEFERVEDAPSMREALSRGGWDLILSDWTMPRFSALAALAQVQATGCDLPFMIVSGSVGEEPAVEAMRAGAHDYVLKDRLARLAPAVERELRECVERKALRAMEGTLRAQETRFRAMIENSQDGIALTGRDGTLLYLSPSGGRIIGYTPEYGVGRRWLELLHPEEGRRRRERMAFLVERPGKSINFDARVAQPDGSYRWVEFTVTNMLDDPSVEAFVTNLRDVTDRKQALEALQASEKRYRRMVETTNEGVWTFDAEAKTTFMNARMGALLGCAPDAATGRTPLDFLAEELHPRFAATLEALRQGEPDQVELAFHRADGSTVWTLLEATPVLDAAGGFEGGLAMVMDITARRQAEASLRVTEARFRGLWESGLIVVAIFDLAGRIRDINDAGARLLGYARTELNGGAFAWADLNVPEGRVADDHALMQLRTLGVAPPWERELMAKDGRRVPLLMGAAMLGPDEGITIGVDLTERNRAERALRQTEEQLRHAQKMEAVGRLAGGVAHDFNNVLSVILTLSDLARDDLPVDHPLRDDLDEIHKAGQRAADLTGQLLQFSRQQVIEPKVLDPNDLLSGMEKMLRRLVGEDVDLVLLPSSERGRVRVDPGSLEQVVMNLVVNARDAMPVGGRLTIETANVILDEAYARNHHGVSPGPHVSLVVSDTGTGMDQATQARIFEPFFTTKEQGKGTGLGLSTVFGIVRQNGGSVWVYSELGRGTTFKVFLPRVDAEAEALRTAPVPDLRTGTETILLVEDEASVRAVAHSILRRQGYDVVEAMNARDALRMCEERNGAVHLLLTDVVMPGMGGPELARQLTRMWPAIRVLCMSGYTDDSVARHGVGSTFAYVQKPITPDVLTRKVREVLDGPLRVERLAPE